MPRGKNRNRIYVGKYLQFCGILKYFVNCPKHACLCKNLCRFFCWWYCTCANEFTKVLLKQIIAIVLECLECTAMLLREEIVFLIPGKKWRFYINFPFQSPSFTSFHIAFCSLFFFYSFLKIPSLFTPLLRFFSVCLLYFHVFFVYLVLMFCFVLLFISSHSYSMFSFLTFCFRFTSHLFFPIPHWDSFSFLSFFFSIFISPFFLLWLFFNTDDLKLSYGHHQSNSFPISIFKNSKIVKNFQCKTRKDRWNLFG